MLVTAEASVNMSTDHNRQSHSLDRIEQLAATNVLHAARVQLERPVAAVDRRLMRYQDVDAVGDGVRSKVSVASSATTGQDSPNFVAKRRAMGRRESRR